VEVAIAAAGCINVSVGEYEVGILLNNTANEVMTATIYPGKRVVELLPHRVTKVNVLIPYDKGTIKAVISDGEEFVLEVPPCVSDIAGGGVEGGGNIALSQEQGHDTQAVQQTPDSPTIQPTKDQPATTPEVKPPNSIPEFQWIGLPVIMVFLFLMLLPCR
jgi:hypothetical protein